MIRPCKRGTGDINQEIVTKVISTDIDDVGNINVMILARSIDIDDIGNINRY